MPGFARAPAAFYRFLPRVVGYLLFYLYVPEKGFALRVSKLVYAKRFAALSLMTAAACAGATGVRAAPKAAVFDFQLANLGQLPPTKADLDRLPHLSDELRDLLQKSGLYDIVPVTSLASEIAKGAPLRACGGCAVDDARKLGADVAITGEIQKVSNLILNINVYIAPVNGAGREKAYSVDIRGDTDESFDRGVKYLVKNNILHD